MTPEQDLIYWVPSFYVLEDLLIRFKPAEFSHSRIRLKDDICEARRSYTRLLANLLFDVLAKMCFGEARHAQERCGAIIPEIQQEMDKRKAYELSEQFDPMASLPKLRDLFLECWIEPYGGGVWAIIAETAMKYRSLPDEIFIDYCVDLSHHGGLVFNKPETGFHVWHKRKYLDLLDCKRNGSILDTNLSLPVFSFAQQFLARAHALGIIASKVELVVSENNAYRPVQWGTRVLSDPQSPEGLAPAKLYSDRATEEGTYAGI